MCEPLWLLFCPVPHACSAQTAEYALTSRSDFSFQWMNCVGGIFAARPIYALKKSFSDRGHAVRHPSCTAISHHTHSSSQEKFSNNDKHKHGTGSLVTGK